MNEISGEPIALGLVGLVRNLPVLIFYLLAGTAADVVNRRRLMFITQTVLALLAGLLGLMTLSGQDSMPLIFAFLAISAAVWLFHLPARQSLIPNLAPKESLANAFSLSSISYQLSVIVGPARSVLSGGIGCLLAVGWIARIIPQLRGYKGDEPVRAGAS
jgi:MFS family permease